MKLRNDAESWGLIARLLHWSMAAIIVFMLVVGVYMTRIADDMVLRFGLTQTHKSWGFVVFALVFARLGWRLAQPAAPEPPADTKPWEAVAARATHVGFYVLMALMPLTGWLMASASPLNDEGAYPVQIKNRVFGLFELPDPIAPGDETLEAAFHALHLAGAIALAAFLALHVGAALKHHFVLRDGVLKRMVWGK